jgi:single-strand DNA-binding protein
MASFNKVMLMGNLTTDPELTHTTSGAPVSGFGLEIIRKYKIRDEWREDVCFVDITTQGNLAENCSKYLSKGSPVFVEGHLNFGSSEKDGEKRNKLDVVASIVQFLGSKQSLEQEGTSPPEHIKKLPEKVDLPDEDVLPF